MTSGGMDKQSAIEKIKKCMALSGSSNEHEAAAAMRQARKLMEKFELLDMAEDFFKLGKEDFENGFKKPPAWYFSIGNIVGDAFGCTFFSGPKNSHFVGKDLNSKIAKYAFDIVLRLAVKAKQHFLTRTQTKWATVSRKRQLGQAFCEGFALGMAKVVREFAAPITKDERDRHVEFLQLGFTRQIKFKELTGAKLNKNVNDQGFIYAAQKGFQDGKEISLHNGVGDAGSKVLRLTS